MGEIKKAIILVAGLGNRLRPLTNDRPKCLVEVNGTPILVNTLKHLANHGIKEVVLAIGYQGKKIEELFGDNYLGMKIIYGMNEAYDKTNNMFSLWLVRNHLKDGVLLIEGDSFFEEEMLVKLLNTDNNSYWAGDKFDLFKDGCMLTAGENGVVEKIEIIREKLNEYQDNFHKSGGMLKITPELGEAFSNWLDQEVKAGNVNIYYDLVLAKHLGEVPLFVCNIHGSKWFEIDDLEDLRKTEELFKEVGEEENGQRKYELKYEIVPIERLKPLERVFPTHLKNLNDLIIKDGVVQAPLLADRKTGIILDGSHRYIFFLMHGYKTVPVQFIDYDDEHMRVGTHLMHRHLVDGPVNISKAEVVRRGLTGDIYSPRTTRHFFPFRKISNMALPLSKLEKGESRDVSKFIENVNTEEEIAHNEKFIREIEQEVDEIISCLSECKSVKHYLQFQIDKMRKK